MYTRLLERYQKGPCVAVRNATNLYYLLIALNKRPKGRAHVSPQGTGVTQFRVVVVQNSISHLWSNNG